MAIHWSDSSVLEKHNLVGENPDKGDLLYRQIAVREWSRIIAKRC
jgi:hypothetical protein